MAHSTNIFEPVTPVLQERSLHPATEALIACQDALRGLSRDEVLRVLSWCQDEFLPEDAPKISPPNPAPSAQPVCQDERLNAYLMGQQHHA